MNEIKRVVVEYDDGRIEEWTGEGRIRMTETTAVMEGQDGRVKDHPVKYLTIGMSLKP